MDWSYEGTTRNASDAEEMNAYLRTTRGPEEPGYAILRDRQCAERIYDIPTAEFLSSSIFPSPPSHRILPVRAASGSTFTHIVTSTGLVLVILVHHLKVAAVTNLVESAMPQILFGNEIGME